MTYTPPPAHGDCPTGKWQYATRKQAKAGGRRDGIRRGDGGLRPYRCADCDWWHVGHVPQRVRTGEVDKAAWLDAATRRNA